jgi:hypothetical protein
MRTHSLNIAIPALTEAPQPPIEQHGPTDGRRLVIEVALRLEIEADGALPLSGGCIALRAYQV